MILVLDTSLIGVAMGLMSVDAATGATALVWHDAHPEQSGSVPAISGLLTRGLAATGTTMADLTGVTVSQGPGSFTGIKIGLAFVYGLMRARPDGLPALGLSGIVAASKRYAAELNSDFALFVPATRTHGYLASTGVDPRLFDASRETASAAIRALGEATPLAVCGRWPLLQEQAREAGRSVLEIAPSDVSRQAIYGMSEETGRLWPQGFGTGTPEPKYLRLSTAEERLQSR